MRSLPRLVETPKIPKTWVRSEGVMNSSLSSSSMCGGNGREGSDFCFRVDVGWTDEEEPPLLKSVREKYHSKLLPVSCIIHWEREIDRIETHTALCSELRVHCLEATKLGAQEFGT